MTAQTMPREQIIATYKRAAALIDQGVPEERIQQMLMEDGFSKDQAAEVLSNLPAFRTAVLRQRGTDNPFSGMGLWCVGLLVFAAGLFLFIGNVTGLCPTLPFAGYLTMTLGGALLGSCLK